MEPVSTTHGSDAQRAGGEEMRGELVDPLSQRQRRFTGLESLVDAVQAWIDDVRGSARDSTPSGG
jgi:hypothetical protein